VAGAASRGALEVTTPVLSVRRARAAPLSTTVLLLAMFEALRGLRVADGPVGSFVGALLAARAVAASGEDAPTEVVGGVGADGVAVDGATPASTFKLAGGSSEVTTGTRGNGASLFAESAAEDDGRVDALCNASCTTFGCAVVIGCTRPGASLAVRNGRRNAEETLWIPGTSAQRSICDTRRNPSAATSDVATTRTIAMPAREIGVRRSTRDVPKEAATCDPASAGEPSASSASDRCNCDGTAPWVGGRFAPSGWGSSGADAVENAIVLPAVRSTARMTDVASRSDGGPMTFERCGISLAIWF
jgi:hypothetical protein